MLFFDELTNRNLLTSIVFDVHHSARTLLMPISLAGQHLQESGCVISTFGMRLYQKIRPLWRAKWEDSTVRRKSKA
jgi:hypothetical protein